jgi:predicted kinase
MKTLTMVKGLPGSGKTSWAKAQQTKNSNIVRVNKDDLRAMMHNSIHSKGREQFVLQVRNLIIEKALGEGHHVIVDDTNFNPKHEEVLRELVKVHECKFEIHDMGVGFETDAEYLDHCIKNDLKRPNSVGEKVIRTMYNQYLKVEEKVEPVADIPGLPAGIICDLDGTLCLFPGKNPYERDFENDQENPVVLDLLIRTDSDNFDYRGEFTRIIFVSGRSDKFRDVTRKWLDDRGFRIYPLFMRKDGDIRKDVIIKQELYEQHIKGKYNVRFVLDDRDQVVKFWRSIGLTCLQVAPGDF